MLLGFYTGPFVEGINANVFWPLIVVNYYAENGAIPFSFPLSADGITRIECGSLGRPSLPRLKVGESASTTDGGVAPSPSSHVMDSFSPSPTSGHRRTRTQRVRDLLLSIDGLVMESEQAEQEDALVSLPPLSPDGVRYDASGAGAAVLAERHKRHSTGSASHSGGRDEPAGRDTLRTPPDRNLDEPDRPSPGKRTFFPHEKNWGAIAPFPTTSPQELSVRVPSAAGGVAEGIDDGVEYSDKLLAEVDWLIAGTEAALGGVTPEVVNGEAATFDKRGAKPVNGHGGDVSLEGANTYKQGVEGTEQAVERAEVGVETGNEAGFVLREKDAKMSEVRLPSSPAEASLTEVSLDTVSSPKTRGSDESRTEPESRGSEQTLSPDIGNGFPANIRQTPTVVVRRDHFGREREATAVLTSGGDASVTAESVGSRSIAVTSVWQGGAVDRSKGEEEGRSLMPNVNAAVKTVGENGGPSWGEKGVPHGGSPRFEAEQLAPAAMLETLSETFAPALSRSQMSGNPVADDSDADKGDLGPSAAPFSSVPATKPPFVVNGNGKKTSAE